MLLIKNGRVIDPAGKTEKIADIVVKDGKIMTDQFKNFKN